MNTPTQITLSNSLVINQSTNTQTNAYFQLPEEVLAAKNIQFSKDSIALDVFIDKHWQRVRLGTTNAPQNAQKIASANIQISPDGKQLNISPNGTTLTLNKPEQFQRLLNYVNTGTEVQSKPMDINVVTSPNSKLVIGKLNASIAINKELAQSLLSERPLKVIINMSSKGAQLDVVNRFADTVHSQTLSQTKFTKLLATLLPNAQLHTASKLAILTHPQKSGSFTTTMTNTQIAELPNTSVKVNVVHQADKLFIKTDASTVKVTLNNSFSKPFNDLLLAQKNNAQQITDSALTVKENPLLASNSPIKSWLQDSLSDLKTRINDAVKYFENKPFASQNKVDLTLTVLEKLGSMIQPTGSLLSKINITQNTNDKLTSTTSNILPEHFSKLPPLMQLTQLIKGSVTVWQTTPSAQSTINDSNQSKANLAKTKGMLPIEQHSPNATSRSQMLQPIEAKLLSTLLKIPDTLPPGKPTNNKLLLSSQLTNITSTAIKETPELTRLINQAFNRMVSSNNVNPVTIQREILATLRPTQLPGDTLQSSFTKGLEQVAVSILAAPIINQSVTPLTFNNQTGIDALLHVLIPAFKTGNTGTKILEQLQQAQVQVLANEIVNAKNTLTQVTVTTPNQQPDTNPLAQFLLPMKLPPDAAQTEITLGQYKKPGTGKLEDKNVWFVRLNFDYEQLGQLQITAELMDKALDCQLLASSQEVSAIAHPHLDNLRSKLAKHGLQVGELNLKRGDTSHQAFYNSHAIINIKV